MIDTRVLEGVKIVELGQFIAVPAATLMLADYGADVIKVESVLGDGSRTTGGGTNGDSMFRAYNRSKRSIVLNLKASADRDVLIQMLRRADLIIENYRPGSLAKLGITWELLQYINDQLIYLAVRGYPHNDDKFDQRRGFDVAAQAESGIMSINGERHGAPLKVGFAVVDVASSYLIVSAALLGLVERARTGVGTYKSLSLYETALHLQSQQFVEYWDSGSEPVRVGNMQPYAAPAADLIEVRDGSIVLSAYPDDHWRRLCMAIGCSDMIEDPRYADNASRVKNRRSMMARLTTVLNKMSVAECVERISGAGVVVAAVRTYGSVEVSEDFLAADMIVDVQGDDGRSEKGLRTPFDTCKFVETLRHVPGLGEHSDEIRDALSKGCFWQ